MDKCTRCGRHGLFLVVNNRGHCADCIEEIKEERRRQGAAQAAPAPTSEPEPDPAPMPEPILEPPAAEEPAKPKKPEPHSRSSCIVGIACLLFIVVAIIWGFIAMGREARELKRLSDETGLSVESIQRLETLAIASGTDFDVLIESAKHLGEAMEEAAAEMSQETPEEASEFSVLYGEGQYVVGPDMEPGEYIVLASDDSGYVAVTADANGDDIIFNTVFETNTMIEVRVAEYCELSGCYAVPLEEYHAVSTVDMGAEGIMVKVGVDIPAGEYKATATGDSGYYCIYSDLRHDDIVDNDIFDTTSWLEVEDGQYLELSGCTIED